MDGPATDSPLESVSAPEQATEAFALLSNETRLAILVALWESHVPFTDDTAVRFSELRARVGTTDSGRFNYHLDQLEGHFVESVADGYELTQAGLKFVRSVVAGAGIETPRLEPTEVDVACTLCGEPVAVSYEDGWLYVRCTDCAGIWAGEDGSRGNLAKFSLPPAGLTDRSPAELYAAAWVSTFQQLYSMIEGVCPTCSGPVERSLLACPDHDPDADGECPTCDRRLETVARFRCPVCKDAVQSTIGGVAKYHPRVVGFCYDRGLTLQYGFNDLDHIEDRLTRSNTAVERVSEDPLRIRVTTELDGEGVWVELDEALNVTAVED